MAKLNKCFFIGGPWHGETHDLPEDATTANIYLPVAPNLPGRTIKRAGMLFKQIKYTKHILKPGTKSLKAIYICHETTKPCQPLNKPIIK